MLVMENKLKDDNSDVMLIQASSTLNKWGYNSFFKNFQQIASYNTEKNSEDDSYKEF